MTTTQKIIKYGAMALAIALIAGIFSGIGQLILGITLITDFKERDEIIGEMVDFQINGNTEIIEISVDAATLRIETGEKLAVSSNFNDMEVKSEDGKLKIKEKSHNVFNVGNNGTIIVVIPEGVEFDKFTVNTGVSAVSAEALSCEELELNLGAGNAYIELLNVSKKAEIECGVGELQIKSGNINNLDLSHGVGKADINAVITGKSDIEAGVGELILSIPSDRSQYTVEAETGIGSIKLDGERLQNDTAVGEGENILNIEGGIGSVKIYFASVIENIE